MKIFKSIYNLFIGQNRKEDRKMIQLWKNESEKNLTALKAQLELEQLSEELIGYDQYNKTQAWKNIDAKINPSNVRKLHTKYKIAAASILFLISTYFTINHLVSETQYISSHVTSDFIESIELNDKSQITLDRKSRLFESSDRHVSLEGRAFFNVTQVPGKVFTIQTKHGLISVLGTQFCVFTNEVKTEILVTEGKVKHSSGNTVTILEAGDFLIVSKEGITKAAPNSNNYLSWKDKSIRLIDADLKSLVLDLSNYYNVPIVLNNDLNPNLCKINTVFSSETLVEALNELSVMTGLQYEIVEGIVNITEIKC